MKKQILAIILVTLILPAIATAQLHLTGAIGGGMSYVKAKNLNTRFMPIPRPNISALVTIPIIPDLALQVGAGYTPKGYNTDQTEHFGANKAVFTTKTRLNYLSLPLMLSVRAFNRPASQVWIDGGMNYDLFLHGKTSYDYGFYEDKVRTTHNEFTNKVAGRFSPSKYGPTENTYDVNGLDVALKLQVRYIYRQKYSISVYHEHSLYDMRSNIGDDATSVLKSRYTGVALGYIIF